MHQKKTQGATKAPDPNTTVEFPFLHNGHQRHQDYLHNEIIEEIIQATASSNEPSSKSPKSTNDISSKPKSSSNETSTKPPNQAIAEAHSNSDKTLETHLKDILNEL
ncbi:unnamed protein product [Rotaria sordida]|uniref:Uncharacterized protein n=1 Tax=Rotaria sordida TaxID=392033 RepID=A0A819BSA1_9BILA|nr:unnamed protein product [Rotaria sordida]CAF3801605.1 unnamed protein product [Rotaria sordida]